MVGRTQGRKGEGDANGWAERGRGNLRLPRSTLLPYIHRVTESGPALMGLTNASRTPRPNKRHLMRAQTVVSDPPKGRSQDETAGKRTWK